MSGFSGADRNRPAGQFFLNITSNGCGISRNDDFLIFDFVCNAAFLHEHADVVTGELSGSPGRHDRQAL